MIECEGSLVSFRMRGANGGHHPGGQLVLQLHLQVCSES